MSRCDAGLRPSILGFEPKPRTPKQRERMTLLDVIPSVVGAVVGIATVVVGHYFGLRVSKQQIEASQKSAQSQIQASTVCQFRQQWIDGLREDIALLTSLSLKRTGDNGVYDHLQKMVEIQLRIQLRLNPNETDHKALTALLDELIECASRYYAKSNTRIDDGIRMNEISKQIVPVTQTILKREWNRVKENS